jgi:hypothetical protein
MTSDIVRHYSMDAIPAIPLALVNTDVLREVLGQVACCEDYSERGAMRSNLLSAALCCRAFKEISLDLLWRTIYSIIPLLKILPGIQEIQNTFARLTLPTRHIFIC